MRRILLFLLFLVATVTGQPAQAAGAKEGAPGTNVEMPFLIAPMNKGGKLLGYAYILSKMVTSSPSAAIAVREKLAFIQDAYVRDVNATPICKADDPRAVDETLLNDRMVAVAKRIVGSNKVERMVFISVQFAPLHPSEVPADPAPPSDNASAAGDAAPAADQTNGQNGTSAAASGPATSKPTKDATH